MSSYTEDEYILREQYALMIKKNRGDRTKTNDEFYYWCEQQGYDMGYVKRLLESVQIGPIEEKYDLEHYEDIQKDVVCFSAEVNINEIYGSNDGRIYMKPDKKMEALMQDKNLEVIAVSGAIGGNNSSPISFHLKSGIRVYDKSQKKYTVKTNPDAKSCLSIARCPITPSKDSSILNGNSEPLALSGKSYASVDEVLEDLIENKKPEINNKGKKIKVTQWVVPADFDEMNDLIESEEEEPMTDEYGMYILTEKKAKKYAKVLASSVHEALKGSAKDLVVFLEPTHDLTKTEGFQSKKSSITDRLDNSSSSRKSKKITASNISPIVVANATISNPISMGDTDRINKILNQVTTVNVGLEVSTIRKRSDKEKESSSEEE